MVVAVSLYGAGFTNEPCCEWLYIFLITIVVDFAILQPLKVKFRSQLRHDVVHMITSI